MTKIIKNKKAFDQLSRWTTLSFAFIVIALFIILVCFIFSFAIKGFQNFGFSNILFSGDFNASNDHYSFWIPFSITLLTSLIAIVLASFLGIKVALFTKYRLHKKYQKLVIVIFQVLSGIPSVIFGLFVQNSLGIIWQKLFGINPNSIFNSSIMLTFMIIPTIVTMTLDSLNNISDDLINAPLALGNTKTRVIYKIARKAAMPGIIVGIILAISRAIGESMAVSMLLQAQPSSNTFSSGLHDFFNSSSQTLGAFISTAMFADKDPEKLRPLLYTFGFLMLVLSMVLNIFILSFSRKKSKKHNSKFVVFEKRIYNFLLWVPRQVKNFFISLSYQPQEKVSLENIHEYVKARNVNYKFKNLYLTWKLFWEIFATIICLAFVVWIVFDVIVGGLIGIAHKPETFFIYSKNSTSQSFFNTILIILICLVIGFPISLFVAIYLNEFSKSNRVKKIIVFFLDSLGTTPSIIFGMFGLLLFVQTFGWTSNGIYGNSLIAGAMTLIIVIIPSFTRLLEQSLKNVPEEIRSNSLALGNTKIQTIWKLVLPIALVSITTSIISTIGRIFSETAPLYLTAGLSSSSYTMLNRPGTTLTTQIYAQIFSVDANAQDIQYQAAFLTMLFILLLILIGYVLIPNRKKIKDCLIHYKNVIFNSKNKTKVNN